MNNKINILHLYYDLMNLYGESGNIKAIEYYLTQQNIKTNIIQKSINDNIELGNIDLIYIGCATETNQLIALNHLKQYKEELKEYIEKISNSINHRYVEKSTLEILSKSCEVTEREEKETWN